MMDKMVLAIDAIEDCQEILDDLSSVGAGKKSPLEVLDSFVAISIKVIGEDETIELFEPVTGALLAGAAGVLQAAGCAIETTDKLEAQAPQLASYLIQYGFQDFFDKWKEAVVESLLSKISEVGDLSFGDFSDTVDQIIDLFCANDESPMCDVNTPLCTPEKKTASFTDIALDSPTVRALSPNSPAQFSKCPDQA